MSSIKGVMLMPLDAESYRRHVAHHTFLAKANSGTKFPDPNQELTQLVENKVRQELALQYSPTNLRILRWEEFNRSNRYDVKYRELDGVYKTPTGVNILLEVKASCSKSSLKAGLKQLRKTMTIAAHGISKPVGILVIADLGEWFETFGQAATSSLKDYFAGMNLNILDWPPCLPTGSTSDIYISILPGQILGTWLPD
jgi:hypothetical protein